MSPLAHFSNLRQNLPSAGEYFGVTDSLTDLPVSVTFYFNVSATEDRPVLFISLALSVCSCSCCSPLSENTPYPGGQVTAGKMTKGQVPGGQAKGGNLTGATVMGADLSGAHIKGANIMGTNVVTGSNQTGPGGVAGLHVVFGFVPLQHY